METAYIQVIVLLHAAFFGVFYFLHRQHPTKFARYIACGWLIEACRAAIRLPQIHDLGGWSYHWYALSDVLCVIATWYLVVGCADLAGVRISRRLSQWYVWASVPILIFNRYGLPPALNGMFGLPAGTGMFDGVLANQILLFIPMAVARLFVLWWLLTIWRKERLPGALLAAIFGVPYALVALAWPVQYYFGYNADWISLVWCARVLGFSIGLVMLLLNQQLAALQKGRSQLATAQASARLGSWEYEFSTGEGSWSTELYRLMGREPALGTPTPDEVRQMVHPDDRPAFDRHWARALVTPEGLLGEYRIVRSDRSMLWVEARTEGVVDETGRRVRLTGTVQDITLRKDSERRIHEQAEIIDRAPFAVAITDLDNRTIYCNEGAARLYGIPAEKIIGRTAEEIFPPEVMKHFGPGRDAALATGRWRGEVPLRTTDGRELVMEYLMSLIYDDNHQPKARLSIGVDITEKKLLEEQFLRAQRVENLGLLASGIAHDFNNILTPVLMVGPMLQDAVSDEASRQLLKTVEQSAQRGAALVRQILAFAQGTGGRRALVHPAQLMRDLATLIQETFPRSIKFAPHFEPQGWTVMANATQLHQVLLNLCVNARDAMSRGGTLTLRLSNCMLDSVAAAALPDGRPGHFVVIEVSDTGDGIHPGILSRIWEPFFSTKLPDKGTGLGLSTVRSIVDHHEGFCDVRTALGAGTTFSVYLPAAELGLQLESVTTSSSLPAQIPV